MIKKLLATSLLASTFLLALPNNEIQLAMLAKATEKKAVVLATMKLKEDKKESFGKLYDEYQVKLMKIQLRRTGLLMTYVHDHKQLTNETSDQLITKWIIIEDNEQALKKKYILKFRSFLASADVIRYFQIENRFKVMHQAKLMSQIPLATPPALSTDMAIELSDAPVKAETLAE